MQAWATSVRSVIGVASGFGDVKATQPMCRVMSSSGGTENHKVYAMSSACWQEWSLSVVVPLMNL